MKQKTRGSVKMEIKFKKSLLYSVVAGFSRILKLAQGFFCIKWSFMEILILILKVRNVTTLSLNSLSLEVKYLQNGNKVICSDNFTRLLLWHLYIFTWNSLNILIKRNNKYYIDKYLKIWGKKTLISEQVNNRMDFRTSC